MALKIYQKSRDPKRIMYKLKYELRNGEVSNMSNFTMLIFFSWFEYTYTETELGWKTHNRENTQELCNRYFYHEGYRAGRNHQGVWSILQAH